MKLSFSTVGCPDWPWKDIISSAADFGFQGVEIRGVGRQLDAPFIPAFSPEKAQETKAQLAKMHLEIPVLASSVLLNSPDPGMLELGRQYIDTAERIGAKYIRLLADEGVRPQPVDMARVAAHCSELAEYADGKPVTLLIETNGAFADSERLLKLLNHVKRDNVGVLWDIHHPFRIMGEPMRITYKALARYIRHTHIKDSVVEGDRIVYKPVGEGTLPVQECVRMLRRDGYDGYFSLEWVRRWEPTLEAPGVVFSRYLRTMRRWDGQ